MTQTNELKAVVLMNLGGPDDLDAVEPFLFHIFNDRDMIQLPLGFLWQKQFAKMLSRKRAPESRSNYEKIGGRSPILEHTKAQARAIEERLGDGYRCYVAMRSWHPFTEEAVDQLLADGATEVIALPLYPQRSRTTSYSSIAELRRVLKRKAPHLPLKEVCCWPAVDGFLDAWADEVRRTMEGIAPERRAAAHVLFSAHGLPQSVIDKGDPYLDHVQASCRGVMARLPEGQPWSLSFQSRATRAKWLEPDTEVELARLGAAGVKDVVVVAIAFVTEHVETLFELDLLLRPPAEEAGIEGYHRVPVPATAPSLMEALADLVRGAERGELPPCAAGSGMRCARRGDRKV